jgi:hypothetical protein
MTMYYVYELVFFVAMSGAVFLSIFNTKLAKIVLLLLVAGFLVVISFRTPDYNLDVFYYSRMFNSWPLGLFESWIVKLEPLHFYLRLISPTFNFWLAIESCVFFTLYFMFSLRSNFPALLFLGSVSLPLMSSSFRFAIAIVLVSYIMLRVKNYLLAAVLGGTSHLVAFAVYVKKSPVLFLFFIPFVLVTVSYLPAAIIERMPGFGVLHWAPSGIRSGLAYIYIIYFYKFFYKSGGTRSEVFLVILLVLIASTVSALLNRVLIISLACFIATQPTHLIRFSFDRRLAHMLSMLLYWIAFVVAPGLMLFWNIESNESWQLGY